MDRVIGAKRRDTTNANWDDGDEAEDREYENE
jgi:hypothetical protein